MESVQSEKDVKAESKATEAKKMESGGTLVDTVFDLGLSWAEFGVSQGKLAILQSAKTLEKVARSLEDLQKRLKKD
jgi:hypothetical protein